jgi:hypothetical protein
MFYDGSININTKIDEKGFNTGISKLTNSVRNFAAAVGIAFGVSQIVKLTKNVLSLGAEFSRLKKSAALVGEMFGYTDKQVNTLVTSLIDSGIQTDAAANSFTNFARNGLDTSLLPSLARGAQDLNAFSESGETSTDMFNRLMNGILELNPLMLRNAGLVVDLDAGYKKWAKANKTTVDAMSGQQKQEAALIAVTEQLKTVNGLYELSQKTAAGQMSSNIRIMTELKASMGELFEGPLYTLIKGFNTLIVAITSSIRVGGKLRETFIDLAAIAQFLANGLVSLFQSIASFLGLSVETSKQVADNAADSKSSLAEAANSAGDLADNTTAAGKAAKGALASFDELNVLAQQDTSTSDTGTSGTSVVPLSVDTTQIETGLDSLQAKVTAFKDSFLKFIQPTIDAFNRLKTALVPLGETIWSGLKWAWDNILVPFGSWVMQDAVPVFLDLLAGAATLLNTVLETLKPLGIWLWENFLQPLADWTGGVIIDILNGLATALLSISDWINNNQVAFQTMTIIVIAFFAAWKIGVFIGDIVNLVTYLAIATGAFIANTVELWNNVTAWIANTAAKVGNAAETVIIAALLAGDFIKNIIVSAINIGIETAMWIANTAAKIAQAVAQLAVNIAVGAWNVIGAIASAVTWAFGAAMAFLTSPIFLVIAAIVAIIAIIVLLIKYWPEISAAAGKAWDWIKSIWGIAWDWFKGKVIDPLVNGFTSALNWIKTAFHDAFEFIGNFVRGYINIYLSIINGFVSGVVWAINAVIGALNSIHVSIPSWVPTIGGRSFGVDIPKINYTPIPYLATGAVIPANAPFAAILGDQKSGTNIEAPESLIRKIIQEEMGSQTPQRITIDFGNSSLSTLIRTLNPVIKQENDRRGTSLLDGVS